jgi:hypothetical protein
MFSSFELVDAGEKLAEPVITVGFSPSGSINSTFVWRYGTRGLNPVSLSFAHRASVEGPPWLPTETKTLWSADH